VIAVDDRDIEQPPQLSEHMAADELLGGHAGPVVLDQRGHEEHVEVAAEVEQEDRGAPFSQVLPARHVQPDAAQREDRPRPEPREEVDPGAPVPVGQPDAKRGRGQRAE
jgi:hypothetical protein